MAGKVKTPENKKPRRLWGILIFLIYLAMLILVLVFFTGHGKFIYEGF